MTEASNCGDEDACAPDALPGRKASRGDGGDRRGTGAIVFAILATGALILVALTIHGDVLRLLVGVGILVIAGNVLDVGLRPARRELSVASLLLFSITTLVLALLAAGILFQTIADVPNRLLAIAIVVLVSTGALAYRLTRLHGVPRFLDTVREFVIVIACFAILAVVAVMIFVAADLATPDQTAFRAGLLQGLSGSFIEDLIFFSLLGFILVLLQRRDADRSRNLDDKIELLFSAKKLRSGEAAYLREQVKSISADCREITNLIDVIDHDEARELLLLDVSRRFYVGNYLSSEAARYTLKVDLTPDLIEGHEPAMELFPTITNSVTRVEGEWRRGGDDEVVAQGVELAGGVPYRPADQHLEIRPGQVREFRTRFRGWQPIYKKGAVGAVGGRPVARELDSYEILMLKHWDEIEIHVRNSLNRPLKVAISGSERRQFELLPGDEQRKAYRLENLSANSSINLSFTPP